MSAAGVGKFRDTTDLDVHAIADLNARNIPKTDDSFKYNYTATSDSPASTYSECFQ